MDLTLFLREGFRFTFGYRKRKSPYSQKFLRYFGEIKLIFTRPGWRNWIPRKYVKNNKFSDLEIFWAKLRWIYINFVRTFCENPTPPSKMENRLVYTKGNVIKGTRIMDCKAKWNGFRDLVQLVQFKEREKHPWRSVTFSKVVCFTVTLTVTCENKLLKIYIVLRLKSQKFILLRSYHHECRPWITFLLQQFNLLIWRLTLLKLKYP